jgi:hypothetical protein
MTLAYGNTHLSDMNSMKAMNSMKVINSMKVNKPMKAMNSMKVINFTIMSAFVQVVMKWIFWFLI